MVFHVHNNSHGGIAIINGREGRYDNKVQDHDVRYGRNAIDNYRQYNKKLSYIPKTPWRLSKCNWKKVKKEVENFKHVDPGNPIPKCIERLEKLINKEVETAKQLTPQEFKLQYLPGDNINADNLSKKALLGASFEDLGKKFCVSIKSLNKKLQNTLGEGFSVNAYDVNKDNKIDVAENAVSLLVKDMLDSSFEELSKHNINGVFTTAGEINSNMLLQDKYLERNSTAISQIYKDFELAEAAKSFSRAK